MEINHDLGKEKLYLQEIDHQIHFALNAYERYQEKLLEGDIPEIFTYIHYFVLHSTNVDKILDFDKKPFRKKILKRIPLSEINLKPFRRLRNHLEHFDERLDKWIKKYDGYAYLDMNLIEGCQGFPKKAYLRALDKDTFKFQGEDYDLSELHSSLLTIQKIINSLFKLHNND